MPFLDVGYRDWEGDRSHAMTRWFVVAVTGIKLVWRGTWLRRLMVFLFLPSALTLFFFGIYEQSANDSRFRNVIRGVLMSQEAREAAQNSGIEWKDALQDPHKARHFVWSYLLFMLFRYPQSFAMVLVIGLVAPRLISYDLRSRGYLLYLSRPLTPAEYVLGKASILFFLLGMIATLPALAIYASGLVLSPDPGVVLDTWDIPIRILVATVILVVPTTAVALAFSSMTQESRYAGFAWFSFWVIGTVAYQALSSASSWEAGQSGRLEAYHHWMLLSPYQTLGYLQLEVFGLAGNLGGRWAPWALVGVITCMGYAIAYWRVARMLKA